MAKKTKKFETTEQAPVQPQEQQVQLLSQEEEINGLRAAHVFFSTFDRVPGSLASQWSQALDAIAVVANSLIGKNQTKGE